MKRLSIIILALLGAVTAYGQGETPPFRKTFSLELGAAPGPLHMQNVYLYPTSKTENALAEQGQQAVQSDGFCPAVSLSGALRTSARWETALTGSLSWGHYQIMQYETFGIDPKGKPRYDLNKGTKLGRKNLPPVVSVTVQERVFWNPAWRWQWYSAFGLGFSGITGEIPLLSVVPVGLRLGGDHLYFFAETGFSPFASFGHGGLGWKF